jgi:hypothetical protein
MGGFSCVYGCALRLPHAHQAVRRFSGLLAALCAGSRKSEPGRGGHKRQMGGWRIGHFAP